MGTNAVTSPSNQIQNIQSWEISEVHQTRSKHERMLGKWLGKPCQRPKDQLCHAKYSDSTQKASVITFLFQRIALSGIEINIYSGNSLKCNPFEVFFGHRLKGDVRTINFKCFEVENSARVQTNLFIEIVNTLFPIYRPLNGLQL